MAVTPQTTVSGAECNQAISRVQRRLRVRPSERLQWRRLSIGTQRLRLRQDHKPFLQSQHLATFCRASSMRRFGRGHTLVQREDVPSGRSQAESNHLDFPAMVMLVDSAYLHPNPAKCGIGKRNAFISLKYKAH